MVLKGEYFMNFIKNNLKGILIAGAAVIAVIILVIVGINSVAGNAITYEETVTEAQSAIKIQEKRRADLIPNLVDCVKAYDKHEYETLVDIINARKGSDGTIPDDVVNEVNNIINVVVENYPQLSSQANYKELMNELAITENKIAETRNAYNKTVSRYNTYTRHPIRKFFLSLSGYEKVEFQKLNYDVSEDAPTNLFD